MNLTHPRALPYVLLAGGVLPLAFALVAQFGFGLPPCHFCMLQRYPYLVVALCGVLLLRYPDQRYLLTALAIIGWLTTAGFGAYHTGVERGWVTYGGGCVTDTKPAASLDELREQIAQAPQVSCSDTMASFLGLSMATWNSVTALGWVVLTLYIYRRRPA